MTITQTKQYLADKIATINDSKKLDFIKSFLDEEDNFSKNAFDTYSRDARIVSNKRSTV